MTSRKAAVRCVLQGGAERRTSHLAGRVALDSQAQLVQQERPAVDDAVLKGKRHRRSWERHGGGMTVPLRDGRRFAGEQDAMPWHAPTTKISPQKTSVKREKQMPILAAKSSTMIHGPAIQCQMRWRRFLPTSEDFHV